jgi:hypothetical protein
MASQAQVASELAPVAVEQVAGHPAPPLGKTHLTSRQLGGILYPQAKRQRM